MSSVAQHTGSHKAFQAGTDRVRAPADTVADMRPLFPLFGITRVADVTGLDHIGVPVVMVVRPNSRSLSVAQGKGIDLAAAQASGIMESIETWHAEHMELPLHLGGVGEVARRLPLADVEGLPRSLAMRFSPDAPLLWVEGRELTTAEPLFVPYELVHTDYTLPSPTGTGMFLATSNGLASGNIAAEAHSHALSEVIERDATSLWRLRPPHERRGTRLDLATVDDPLCADLVRSFDRAGIAVGVWETTSDIGVAAFYCVIVDRDDSPLHRMHAAGGMGCHPNRAIALMRALTEAAQSRLTVIAGTRDDVVEEDYRRARAPRAVAEERTQILDEPGVVAFPSVPTAQFATVDDDVRHLVARLRAVGLEQVVAVDLTQPRLGIDVTRIVVPGLEALSDMPGYVPGPRARAATGETG